MRSTTGVDEMPYVEPHVAIVALTFRFQSTVPSYARRAATVPAFVATKITSSRPEPNGTSSA
ncbi:MAG: hypothetical protein ACRDLU_08725 [Gaiellaceae bacterium]